MPQHPIMLARILFFNLIASKESSDEKISCLVSGACISDRRLEENPTRKKKGGRGKDAARLEKMDERSRKDVRRRRSRSGEDQTRDRARYRRQPQRHHAVRSRGRGV